MFYVLIVSNAKYHNTIVYYVFFWIGDCNFESGTCGWSNSRTDQFDWVRLTGNINKYGTHPNKGDHTFGTSKNGEYFSDIVHVSIFKMSSVM